jgi:hypothetical protein
MSTHMLVVLGLILNGLGSLLLVACPPPVAARDITPEGIEKHPHTYTLDGFFGKLSGRKKLKFYIRLYGFRSGLLLLLVGFLLQLIGELMKP